MFIGNQKIVSRLQKAISRNTLSHAYLFTGPEHVGKLTLARKFAKSVIFGSEIDVCSSAPLSDERQIFDLMMIEPEREKKGETVREKNIPVEKIRQAQKDLSLFPLRGKRKVLIISQAEKLTPESQNALLKTLEEPNPTSVIILTSNNPERLLPTIRSRCQRILFSLVDDGEIHRSIGAKKTNAEEITLLSMGRPGISRMLEENKKEFEKHKQIRFLFQEALHSGVNRKLEIAENLSKDAQRAVSALEMWIWFLRRGEGGEKGHSGQKTQSCFGAIEKIEISIQLITQSNANTRLVLENLLLDLSSSAA